MENLNQVCERRMGFVLGLQKLIDDGLISVKKPKIKYDEYMARGDNWYSPAANKLKNLCLVEALLTNVELCYDFLSGGRIVYDGWITLPYSDSKGNLLFKLEKKRR